mmetsp:Transcript_79771/g.124404  ORF Transcript_79771/g.124404 Transcript_79771/m.124404 type:complete len:231 (-) Transcript_79771:13-705(-)
MPLTYPFTPDYIDRSKCMARTWNSAKGGQCVLEPAEGGAGLCVQHSNQATRIGLSHGRVDGPVPLPKLLEFQQVSGLEVASEILNAAPKKAKIEMSLEIARAAASIYADPARFPQLNQKRDVLIDFKTDVAQASTREESLKEGEDVQISTKRAKTAKKATRIQPISEVVPFGDDPVEFVQDNPRKIGTMTYDRYEKYKSAQTPNEALRLGALKGEIPYDFQRGFMKRRNT